jgi:hypothetical protein
MTAETVTAFHQFALNKSLLKILDEAGWRDPTISSTNHPYCWKVASAGTADWHRQDCRLRAAHPEQPDIRQRSAGAGTAPTRELALQVAEAFQNMPRTHGFHVLPVMAAGLHVQIRAPTRGVRVGTPTRDGSHALWHAADALRFLVLI